MIDSLVSIIMPAYNAEPYIRESIESVQKQTYNNWELIITDDCSTDRTKSIAEGFAAFDKRIIVLSNPVNYGAAISRNRSLEHATGNYIAFLDADDLWMPRKLETQLGFMRERSIVMCYTSYETIESDGRHRNIVHIPHSISYKEYLKRPLTCSHTIVFDITYVDKALLVMPDIRRGQDGAAWCQVLKTGVIGYGLDNVLAKNRKHAGSLSNNKIAAIKRTWYWLRKVEKLSIASAAYNFFFYACNAVKKRKRG